jgi:hypothetical protein
MAETEGHQLFQKVLLECNAPPAGYSGRTEPIALDQSARRNDDSHRTLIAPADPRDGHCLIVFFQQIGLVIVNTVQFSTHCDQI